MARTDMGSPGRPAPRRRVGRTAGRAVGVVAVLAALGYVLVLNAQVRSGHVQWSAPAEGPLAVWDVSDGHVLVGSDEGPLVLDRDDGRRVLELGRPVERAALVGDGVLVVTDEEYGVRDLTGEERWAVTIAPEEDVAAIAADLETGLLVLLETRDGRPRALRGVDLADGGERWHEEIERLGGRDPFDTWDLDDLEGVRVLPVQTEDDGTFDVLAVTGERLHEGLRSTTAPFALTNGRTLIYSAEPGCALTVVSADTVLDVDLGPDRPQECDAYAVGPELGYVIGWDPQEGDDQPATMYAVDLATGEPTDLRIEAPLTRLLEAVGADGGLTPDRPGDVLAVRTDAVMRLYDARTGAVVWSRDWPGRFAYDTGEGGALLTGEVPPLVRALTPADEESLRHELRDRAGRVRGFVYETGGTWWTSEVIDHGQALVLIGDRVTLLGAG